MTFDNLYFNKKKDNKPKRSISMNFVGEQNKITNYELIKMYNDEIKKLPYIIINKIKFNNSYELLNYLKNLEKLKINIYNKILNIYDLETKNNLINLQNDLDIIIKHVLTTLLN